MKAPLAILVLLAVCNPVFAETRTETVRVAMRDGEAFMLTKDYLENRANLTVVKTVVTAVAIG